MPQYNGEWTLQAAAQALTSQQWVTDPNFKNTTLLLQADNAANGAQNNTFLDSSTNSFAITRNGNTTQGSFTPFSQQPGYWSNYLNGTSDYLTVANNAAFNFGTSDFSIEFFFYIAGNTAADPGGSRNSDMVTCFPSSGTRNGWEILLVGNASTTGTGIGITNWVSDAAYNVFYTGTITQQTWHHCAIVRSGTTTTVYLDGFSVASGTFANQNVNSGSNPLFVGYGNNYASYTRYFPGYISNLRIVKGAAVYTGSTYTVPTLPLSIYGSGTTSLLTCQSNRFVDNGNGNAGSGFTVTPVSTASVQAFSPLVSQYQWTPTVIGGSGYFDGTTDTLNTAATTRFDFGTGNFTIAVWVYTTSFVTEQGIVSSQDNGSSTTLKGWVLNIGTNGAVGFVDFNNGAAATQIVSSASVIKLNQWQFIVVERRGTSTNQFQLFVDGVAVATGTSAASIPSTTSNNPLLVGNWRYSTDTNREFTGYMAGLKIDNAAVYNGTVSVPTVPSTAGANTQFLLNFTNAGIYDATMKNDLETVGNAQVSTTVVKYGSGSIYFDGTGDWLVGPRSWSVGASESFTMEAWIYLPVSPSTLRMVLSDYNSTTPGASKYWDITSTGMSAQFGATAGTSADGTFSFSTNTWYHVAVVRNNNIVSMYVNGTAISVANSTQTNAFLDQGTILYVGRWGGTTTYEFNGYIDDLRVTKGLARYTANFTPPQVALPRQ